MREDATSVAVVYDSGRACRTDEPERVNAAGHDVTGLQAAWSPVEEPRYSWLTGYLERLDGKEARRGYYARLEEAALR